MQHNIIKILKLETCKYRKRSKNISAKHVWYKRDFIRNMTTGTVAFDKTEFTVSIELIKPYKELNAGVR